jgi:hypothetical protein
MVLGTAELSRSEEKASAIKSDWDKYETGIKVMEGTVRPAAFYRHELNDGELTTGDGYAAEEYEASVAGGPLYRISAMSKITYRRQQLIDSAGDRFREFDRFKFEQGIKYGGAGSNFSGELNYARFYQKNYFLQSGRLIRNMGDIKLNYNTSDFGITFYESVNASGRILRAREYVYVGDGKGDFRKDGDDYVPEPGGDYIEVIRQLGEGDADQAGNYEITGGLRIRLNARALTKDNILSRLSYDGDLNHRTNIAGGGKFRAKYLFPLSKFDSEEMIFKDYNFRQRTTFKLNRSGDYIRHTLKLSRSDGSNFQFEELSDKALSNAGDLKLFSRAAIGLLIATEYSSEKKWLYSGNIDLIKIRARFVPELRPRQAIKMEIPFEYSTEDERIKDLTIESYSLGLKTILNIKNYGRFELNSGYTRVEINKENSFVPYVVAGGKKPGNNYNSLLTARFKLNSYSRIELRYTYKELGDGYNNSTLKLEARAEF